MAAHLLYSPFAFYHDGLHLFGNLVKQLARFIASALLEHGDLQAPVRILHRIVVESPRQAWYLLP
jgi:hypothetical protein